jgi:hypothetical protein
MVAAGPLHGDDEIVELVLLDRLPEPLDGGPEAGLGVRDLDGFDQDLAEEVGEHPLGPGLGAVDTDDAEVLGSDLLDAGMEHPCGLVDFVPALPATTPGLSGKRHGIDLRSEGGWPHAQFSRGSQEMALG